MTILDLYTAIPVVLRHLGRTLHDVTLGIDAAIDLVGVLRATRLGLHDAVRYGRTLRRSRTGLVVVVDHVEHTRVVATIDRAQVPVEEDVVHEVEDTVPTHRRVAAYVRRPEVAHERGVLATERRAKRVVVGVERLGRDGVLDRYIDRRQLLRTSLVEALARIVHVAVERDVLVQTPGARAVVDHDVAHGVATKRVLAVPRHRLATAETHVADDYVVRIDLERLTGDADTITRSRLTGNCNIRCANDDGRLQADDTRHVEDDDAGATLLTGPAERALAAVVEVRDGQYLTAATALRVHTTTLGTREGGNLGLHQVVGTVCPGHIGTTLKGLLLDDRQGLLPGGIRGLFCLAQHLAGRGRCLGRERRILRHGSYRAEEHERRENQFFVHRAC